MTLSNISIGMHALPNFYQASTLAPAHEGVSGADLVSLAADGGATSVRVPLDLQFVEVGNLAAWQYVIDDIESVLDVAQARGIKVIFEPGQTPLEISPDGTNSGLSSDQSFLDAMAFRFGLVVRETYTQHSEKVDVIEAWEVGNEPNLTYQFEPGYVTGDYENDRFYATTVENAQHYARYLESTAREIAAIESELGVEINVIGAGIAHNDYDYMDTMFATLDSLNATNIDGFTIHPYTTHSENLQDPSSGRPTDWIPNPDNGNAESWDYNFSFQGALYSTQSLMNFHGFGELDLYMTEFGVPSYRGVRGAGAEGELDQGRWYAEAFGVIDAWGNSNLQSIVAHDVLDNLYGSQNDFYNAYDGDPNNAGTSAIAEGSFGLYGRDSITGDIYEKPALQVFRAVANGEAYDANRVYITANVDTAALDDVLNFGQFGSDGGGIADGYFVLSRDGNDQVIGSGFDDSIFAGSGNDIVEGGGGADRIYGGEGNDTLYGNAGNDDIYGNTGDDLIFTGSGSNRVDGGTGYDRLVLTGTQASYTINGDGQYVSVLGNGESVEGINLEIIEFSGGSVLELSNADINRGNGGVIENSTPDPDPDPGTQPPTTNTIYGTVGDDYITSGTSENDLIIGDQGVDVIVGSAGNDTIVGGDEYNQMDYLGVGASSNNFVFTDNGDGSVTAVSTEFGQDLLWGIGGVWFGEESEWYSMADLLAASPPPNPDPDPEPDPQPGTTNTVYGTNQGDFLSGTSANDLIIADLGEDIIFGSAGDDVIIGGSDGSSEYDQVNYEGVGSSSGNFTFADNGDGSITAASSQFGQDQLWGIDGIWFNEEAAWYSLQDLVANSPSPNPDPGPAPDPDPQPGTTNTIYGTAGDDIIDGTSANDLIIADAGVDTIKGSAGDDVIIGNEGYNQVNYEGTGSSSDNFTFTNNGDGSITAVSAQFGQDQLWDIGGIWFNEEGAWYSIDDLTV
ncbi:MAG: hypothetical protein AAF478_10265 [Pseudomonadota bacterium]